MTSNNSTADDAGRSLRRSTRLKQSIQLTVVGVDAYRGPYREEVSTVSVNCHGCRYESKHAVFRNAWVILELPAKAPGSRPTTARGIVKWIERSPDENGPQLTAVELDEPGNIWGIEAPPTDWIEHCGPKDPAVNPTKPKPFAVRKLPLPAVVVEEKDVSASAPLLVSATGRPVGQLIGDLQWQMEQMFFKTVNTAVRERTNSTFEEVRASMKEETKHVLAEAAAVQAGTCMAEYVKQMKQAAHDSTLALHTEWNNRMTLDAQLAGERLEERKRDLDQQAQKLSAGAIERVQRGLETLRKETSSRVVDHLKEQLTLVVDEAKKVANLSDNREQLEKMIDQALEKSFSRMEDICARLETQFETIIRSHLDGSREELERASHDVTNLALNNLQVTAQHSETDAGARFQTVVKPVVAQALIDLKEHASETSCHFSDELERFGQTYLAFVGSSVIDLANRLGKRSNQ
jgi:hypothetical protein